MSGERNSDQVHGGSTTTVMAPFLFLTVAFDSLKSRLTSCSSDQQEPDEFSAQQEAKADYLCPSVHQYHTAICGTSTKKDLRRKPLCN